MGTLIMRRGHGLATRNLLPNDLSIQIVPKANRGVGRPAGGQASFIFAVAAESNDLNEEGAARAREGAGMPATAIRCSASSGAISWAAQRRSQWGYRRRRRMTVNNKPSPPPPWPQVRLVE